MTIELDDVDGVAVVRLARDPVNALDLELVTAITATFTQLDASAHRAIVLTGAGRAFSAGVDLWHVTEGGPDYVARYVPALVDAFEAVFNASKPVVAAVNGAAIAGGAILVSGCDVRLMSQGRIGVSELLVGVPFPTAALEILRFAVGDQVARRLILSAETFGPEEAVAHHLVDEVVPAERLLAEALVAANRLAKLTPDDTFRLTKRQLRAEANARIARDRARHDGEATHIWQVRASDGTIHAYMQRIRRGAAPDS